MKQAEREPQGPRFIFRPPLQSLSSAKICDMTIPGEEIALYQAFILEVAKELGAMQCPPDKMLWHYTNGAALISILNSNEIYSTQISCLNDSTELKYGSRLFHTALNDLRTETGNDELSKKLLDGATRHFEENLGYSPASFHFVSCFSEEKDDLSQWRAYGGGENGYAIGFLAADLCGIPNSMLVRVNYDSELHQALAKKAAMENGSILQGSRPEIQTYGFGAIRARCPASVGKTDSHDRSNGQRPRLLQGEGIPNSKRLYRVRP
ncbi:MAG: DUF2971 domain-containing protein [Terracidiphilus sp.]